LDNACILSTDDPTTVTQLQGQSDTYALPSDLTTVLADKDVITVTSFLANLNVPADQITTGQTFAQVLTMIAQIFLAAQAIAGVTGSAIFTTGVTLDSAVSESGASALAPALQASLGAGAGASLGAGAGKGAGASLGAGAAGNSGNELVPTGSGPFDFSQIDGTATISDTLTALAQQYTSTIIIGGMPLQA
jgi:hypothetical protein